MLSDWQDIDKCPQLEDVLIFSLHTRIGYRIRDNFYCSVTNTMLHIYPIAFMRLPLEPNNKQPETDSRVQS